MDRIQVDVRKIFIVIPVFNELNTLETTIQAVKSVDLNLEKEIILVDDATADGTTELIRRTISDPDIIKMYHDGNMGKGAVVSIKTVIGC